MKQELDTETTKTVSGIQAAAKEREFQYDIVKLKLSNTSKTNAERAAVLLFLVRAGVLNSLNRDELQAMAEEQIQNPDKDIIPRLTSTSASPGIVGLDDSQIVTTFPEQHPARLLARSVGRLKMQGKNDQMYVCTAFLVAPSQIVTASHCIKDAANLKFELFQNDTTEGMISLGVDLTQNKVVESEDEWGGYVYLSLREPADASFPSLAIGGNVPLDGAALGLIYFRTDDLARAVWGAADCRVIKLERNLIHHLCDTGAGASGGPIIDVSTNSVVGVQFRRDDLGGVGYRLDSSR